jgi:CRP/FNR family transcriptional regulator, cyclic AMP receptor protein
MLNPQTQSSFAAQATYDPVVALEFFKSAGTPATIAEGKTIFKERQRQIPFLRRNTMYLLLRGEVGLLAGKKPIGRVRPGEIFGEMAVISHAARSASAIAKTPCRMLALDDQRFEVALKKKPAFALMLMSVLIHRLRETVAQVNAAGGFSGGEALDESAVFDAKTLAALVAGLADEQPVYFRERAPIVAEGQKGLRMYAVLEGTVRVLIGGRIVERLAAGGVFGEAALIDAAQQRLASVVAETDCSLQPITREAFLALVKVSPEFAQQMLASLAERLRFLTSRLG